jgi:hypothetical protein
MATGPKCLLSMQRFRLSLIRKTWETKRKRDKEKWIPPNAVKMAVLDDQ